MARDMFLSTGLSFGRKHDAFLACEQHVAYCFDLFIGQDILTSRTNLQLPVMIWCDKTTSMLLGSASAMVVEVYPSTYILCEDGSGAGERLGLKRT